LDLEGTTPTTFVHDYVCEPGDDIIGLSSGGTTSDEASALSDIDTRCASLYVDIPIF